MWKPKSLRLENFRSFVSQEYIFKSGTAQLIQGVNNTDEGAKSNGSGKSSLREALCYVLGLPTYSTVSTDLINDNAKNCTVELCLTNKEQQLVIIRTTPKKGASSIHIALNGDDQSDKFATVPDGNKLIIDLIGISKEDLLNHYIISKEKFTSFFNSSDTKVKELIGRFSNFDKIDGVEDYVQTDIDDLNTQLRLQEHEESQLTGKIELLKEQLEQERNIDTDILKSKQLTEIKTKIHEYNDVIENYKNYIEVNNSLIDEIDKDKIKEQATLDAISEEIKELGGISFEKEIDKLKTSKTEFLNETEGVYKLTSATNDTLKEFEKFKIEVETTIEGAISCPKCLFEFIPNSELSVKEAKKTLPEVLKEIESLNIALQNQQEQVLEFSTEINVINESVKLYQEEIDKFNDHKRALRKKENLQIDEINSIDRKIAKAIGEISRYSTSVENYKNRIIEANKQIEEVKKQEIETREKELTESINELKEEAVKKEENVQLVKDKIFDTEQWIHRFKKFRSYLANESLDIIQGYANMYLKKMKSTLSIQLEGYKTNKNGSIREKITPVILRNGVKEGSGNYKKLSGGERGKIDFATSVLALQSLINNSCSSGGLDLIFTDEITESIDSLGIENLVASLSDLNKTCIVISHVNHEKVHENILTIEKVNGISKIIE